MSDKKTEKTDKAATSADNTAMAAGIIRTVQQVLHDTADSRDELPPGCAGSLGMMLCIAMDLLDCSPKSALKTSLGDVAHILGAAFLEKTKVSPTISAACADIIKHIIEGGDTAASGSGCSCGSCGKCSGSAREDERGRKYVATIPAPPDLAEAGIDTIELWEDRPISAAMKDNAIQAARAAADMMKDVDGLKDESAGLMELVAMGGLKDDKTRKQILEQVVKLLKETAALKKDIDTLDDGKAPADRVPDWRDTASGADQCSASRVHVSERRTDTTGKLQGKPVGEDKPAAKPEEKPAPPAPKKEDKSSTAAVSGSARTRKAKPADGTAEVSGYFTPEEAEKLIEDIREWLSQCRDGHRLGDLINSIEYVFKLSDGQLGELIGVSARLVCKVRHGRPSPFTLARFTEVFGTDGGAGTRDEVSGSARTQKEA